MMYTLFSKKNVIILSVVLLVLVIVNSLAVGSDSSNINIKYKNLEDNTLLVYKNNDKKSSKAYEKVSIIIDYELNNIRENGYANNDIMIKVNALGNLRDDQNNIKIDKKQAVSKNISNKDAVFTYYYNKSTNQYIFINNHYIKDYLKGSLEITFDVDRSKIIRDFKTQIVASIITPDDKAGSNELIYEEKK